MERRRRHNGWMVTQPKPRHSSTTVQQRQMSSEIRVQPQQTPPAALAGSNTWVGKPEEYNNDINSTTILKLSAEPWQQVLFGKTPSLQADCGLQ